MAQLVKNPPAMRKTWVQKISWRRERLSTPIFWLREFHGLYSPWGCKESDTTEQLSLSVSFLAKEVILDFTLCSPESYKCELNLNCLMEL